MPLSAARPRLGFVGLGWIGLHRLRAIAEAGLAEIVAIADASPEAVTKARGVAPEALPGRSIDDVLAARPDGVVIATPSALHADQALAAIEAGAAVFCQKPLGRSAEEVQRVVEAARRADRLLGVDLSYRRTAAVEAIRAVLQQGGIGRVFAADLVFHNAYGPDRAWFFDRALAGGGVVMDLGIHLVDLALWLLRFPDVETVEARLLSGGAPLAADPHAVEDYAVATLDLRGGCILRIACSWRLHAGAEAVIGLDFHGTEGGLSLRNSDGGFYDLSAHRHRGTRSESIAEPPDAWGGRAAADWVARLASGACYDPEAAHLVQVAAVLDRIYAACPPR